MFRSIAALLLLAFAAPCAVASATPLYQDAAENALQQRFVSWLKEHQVSYEVEDFFQRFATFKENAALVEKHNAEYVEGKHSFTLALNRFAAHTNQQYQASVLGLRRKAGSVSNMAPSTFEPTGPAAAAVDWRTKGVVHDPKDQGQCGSCWSFSAVGAMEGAHALATGNLLSLSEQELVDCVNNGTDTCDAGGEMHDGYLEVIAAGGIETEADYPYTASSGKACANDKSKYVATFSSYQNVTSGDEGALAQALTTYPTVSIGIDASSIFFQLYFFGVFDDSSCKNGFDQLDHGVLAVGYDHDSLSGKDYWIVKNSWGGFWGKGGYVWMVRNKENQCGVATDATYPIV